MTEQHQNHDQLVEALKSARIGEAVPFEQTNLNPDQHLLTSQPPFIWMLTDPAVIPPGKFLGSEQETRAFARMLDIAQRYYDPETQQFHYEDHRPDSNQSQNCKHAIRDIRQESLDADLNIETIRTSVAAVHKWFELYPYLKDYLAFISSGEYKSRYDRYGNPVANRWPKELSSPEAHPMYSNRPPTYVAYRNYRLERDTVTPTTQEVDIDAYFIRKQFEEDSRLNQGGTIDTREISPGKAGTNRIFRLKRSEALN